MTQNIKLLDPTDRFVDRHIGPSSSEIDEMLKYLNVPSRDSFIASIVPQQIRSKGPLRLEAAMDEHQLISKIKAIAEQNQIYKSYIGMGYSDCITPPVILRNILENPGWYTAYTPYQAEIAQGRLEALLNFQTMIIDLTGLEIANASLLDESTAAAEAMAMCYAIKDRPKGQAFFVSEACHPQTIEVVRTRAQSHGIELIVANHKEFKFNKPVFGVLLQYPASDGTVHDYREFAEKAHQAGAHAVVAADILSLAILQPPGEWGADIVVGNTQRFGVPLGYGGPHAAFLATKDAYKRQMPGRIVGVSQDAEGRPAVRMALQTREQHIRREKATSNICTSQVLLAVTASMYAVYHGPKGIKSIAGRVHYLTKLLAKGLQRLGYAVENPAFFDTLTVSLGKTTPEELLSMAKAQKVNLRVTHHKAVGVALDEATTADDLKKLLSVFSLGRALSFTVDQLIQEVKPAYEGPLPRKSAYLTHKVFNNHHSETEMLRYMSRLQAKDLSLTHSMIPLGSCTMKLNATAEMIPVTWPEFGKLHPFAPLEQARGYQILFDQLRRMLSEITGFAGISLQPNAGSQGEYAGLLVIQKYHLHRGQGHRNVCLIPRSAHGTNPASAALAGMRVVVVDTSEDGNVDMNDLRTKAQEHKNDLSALMVTYPSTHGVFEEGIVEICKIVHDNGGQVYMDGANMNAQVGLCRPGDFGPDVCHLNLHKTFCIPHGGGGPGMGPIGVATHLVPFLPTHSIVPVGGELGIGAVSEAPWGSASILPISWMYIALMGPDGLTKATEVAMLNANYIAKRLGTHYPVLYKGKNGLVAHECILDLRQLKVSSGVEVEDVAKRLMDYGFHAPTISFPVPGTVMVEPTESESKKELDRFCAAMIAIRQEIAEIESGKADRQNNVLKNAPHTARAVTGDKWDRPYSREKAAYPAAWLREDKFWPSVARINAVLGDRNLICACPPIEEYS